MYVTLFGKYRKTKRFLGWCMAYGRHMCTRYKFVPVTRFPFETWLTYIPVGVVTS